MIIYYILDVLHVKYCHKVVLLHNFNFVIKFSFTIVVKIAHFIIRIRNVFRCFTVVIL